MSASFTLQSPAVYSARFFVSVDDAGGVNRTYGDQSPVDFSAIKDDLYVPSDL